MVIYYILEKMVHDNASSTFYFWDLAGENGKGVSEGEICNTKISASLLCEALQALQNNPLMVRGKITP